MNRPGRRAPRQAGVRSGLMTFPVFRRLVIQSSPGLQGLSVRVRCRAAKQGGEGLDVQPVYGPGRIAGLELKQDVGPDAADRRIVDHALSGQGTGRIGDPFAGLAPDTPVLVKDDDVNIDLPTAPVGQHEVPARRVFCRKVPVALSLQDSAERR